MTQIQLRLSALACLTPPGQRMVSFEPPPLPRCTKQFTAEEAAERHRAASREYMRAKRARRAP